jgi:RNA polymerase sigma factor (sigma-70 family)
MDDLERHVQAARAGDGTAWRQLVDGHTGLVWSVVRGFRFDEETSKDVFQTVWLRLAEHLDRIREPAKLASWLGQTARNECIGVVRQRSRLVPDDDVVLAGEPIERGSGSYPEPGERLELEESRQAVAAAFHRLPSRCQQLLRLLVMDPPMPYDDISEMLEMPVGSIGPTRARCLEAIRASPEVFRISGRLRSS